MPASTDYLNAVRRILDHLESTQLPAIDQAAALVTRALSHGGAVFCADIGHGIQGDFINRAGGLAAVQRFSCRLDVEERVARCLADRPAPDQSPRDLQAIRAAVQAGNLRTGDVMVMGSVSGKNRTPVELALACRDHGVRTIGITSLAYTHQVQSLHPSGKRLFEVVDVVIDNGAPYGDAAVTLDGLEVPALPVSGVSAAVIGHLLWGRVMEQLIAAGTPPTVLMSLNRDGGPDHYQQAIEQYETRGY